MAISRRAYQETILEIMPEQGDWEDTEYLWLTDRSRRLIEYADGEVEVLPMPTATHQWIVFFLGRRFFDALSPQGGIALLSPLRLRLGDRKFREPDLLALRDRHDPRYGDRYWHGADLVVEVVSADDPARDLVTKRREYAAAGIPEYWIVNPLDRTVTVLTLQAGVGAFSEHGIFRAGGVATSVLLPGFAVVVDEIFAELD
jgi:Uma2 family endonuclease